MFLQQLSSLSNTMVFKAVLGWLLLSNANAANWALMAAGSNSYNNYRHQADLCHAYQILVSKGFSKDRIITMSYDDIAHNKANPFPGKIFNTPSPTEPGVDVYNGCNLDYTGKHVTAENFAALLAGTATQGGNGRTLDTGPDDHLTVLYFDHGAPGLIEFPGGDAMHALEFVSILKAMHSNNRYGKMVIYIEACNSGSMLENLPTDINIYGVTAVSADYPSLGTYCGYDAVIDSTPIGSCLGDLFAVYWMKFVQSGDGSASLNSFFRSVYDDVASYAALHYGHELNEQYGDLSIGDLTIADFFYGDSQSDVELAAPFSAPWIAPTEVFAAPRLAMDRHQFEYSEASAMPTFHGEEHWRRMLAATHALQSLLDQQKQTQQLFWDLVNVAIPLNVTRRYEIWTTASKPLNARCEMQTHRALLDVCDADVSTSYGLQFHQVVVNLCAEKAVWDGNPDQGVAAVNLVCQQERGHDGLIV